MTAAIRQQRKRDRAKAGLVRIEAWVPADKADAVREAIARAVEKGAFPPEAYAYDDDVTAEGLAMVRERAGVDISNGRWVRVGDKNAP